MQCSSEYLSTIDKLARKKVKKWIKHACHRMVPNQPTTGLVNDAALPLRLSDNRESIKQLHYKSKPTQP